MRQTKLAIKNAEITKDIMIGEGGEFITMLSGIIQKAPVIPVMGAKSKLQPIYVENTADCVLRSIA